MVFISVKKYIHRSSLMEVKSLKKIIKSSKDHIDKKRTLIIFPEGTRVALWRKINI